MPAAWAICVMLAQRLGPLPAAARPHLRGLAAVREQPRLPFPLWELRRSSGRYLLNRLSPSRRRFVGAGVCERCPCLCRNQHFSGTFRPVSIRRRRASWSQPRCRELTRHLTSACLAPKMSSRTTTGMRCCAAGSRLTCQTRLLPATLMLALHGIGKGKLSSASFSDLGTAQLCLLAVLRCPLRTTLPRCQPALALLTLPRSASCRSVAALARLHLP